MSRTRLALFAAFAVMILALAGCSKEEPSITANDQIPEDLVVADETTEPDADGDGDEGAVFTAEDIKYVSAPDTIPAGTATFTLINDGAAPHDVTIEELGDVHVVHADGGTSETGTVELEAGETYTYYCSIPGHRGAGMEGTFTVE